MKRLLVAMLLLYPLTVMAETYEWTDPEGTVHFAEDLGKVPKKYRKKARRLDADDSVQTSVINENEPAAATKGKGEEPEKGGKKSYGGKDEATWRRDFAVARRDVQASEANLAELRGRLSDTSKMSRSEYLAIQNTIKHEEVHLQGVRKKLDQLEESADRAGVPRELR